MHTDGIFTLWVFSTRKVATKMIVPVKSINGQGRRTAKLKRGYAAYDPICVGTFIYTRTGINFGDTVRASGQAKVSENFAPA